ncbi:MAG: BBP7 family outer membrane beta-barrel protein [Pirellulaceae bacterium]|jgi:hypothetical protein|nr:BBP7 family outer membrane beta-barrel protein [Pirellulaceae bacterium]
MRSRTPQFLRSAQSRSAATLLIVLVWTGAARGQSAPQVAAVDVEASQADYCSPDTRVYFDADYLLWWVRGAPLPPLVTSSLPGTDLQDAGVLGTPGARVLYGDELTSSGPWSGLRLRGGIGLDELRRWWLIADGFYLPMHADTWGVSSRDHPILARPFFDQAIGGANSELVSFPGLVAGGILIDVGSELWGTGVALRKLVYCCPWEGCDSGFRLDVLAGYRYLELSEGVEIYENLNVTDPQGPLLLATRFEVQDIFESDSTFQGVELGLGGEVAGSRYFLSGECRVALGQSQHRLAVAGSSRVSVPGQPVVDFPGGLLAPGKRWEYRDREFAVVPQAELRIGRRFWDHVRCSVGYSLLYWSQVVRAGEHIATTLDSNQLPTYGGTPLAASDMPLRSSSFWAQGLSFQLEWQY